jgi:hypothetical protein
MNWRTVDGKEAMVIAGSKRDQIRNIPLLDWYFEKFETVLSMSNMRLLVIGYGFHDEHINEVVAGSIKRVSAGTHCTQPTLGNSRPCYMTSVTALICQED